MDFSRLFRLIWQINALIILVAGVAACGLLGFSGYTIYRENYKNPRHNIRDVVNVDSNADIIAEWQLGSFEPVNGSHYLVAPAYSKQKYDVASDLSSKETSAVRNYLFVNAVDKSSRWLVPSNSQLFLIAMDVDRIVEEQNSTAKWTMYQVVKADTNGDKRFTGSDKRTIAFSDAVGTNYAEVLSDTNGILSSQMLDDDTMLIFHASNGKNFLTEINIPERRVTVTKELPQIQR